MRRADATIVKRAVVLMCSAILLINFFVYGDVHSGYGLAKAGGELLLLLIVMVTANSLGQKYGRSEVIEYLHASGYRDLADELLKRKDMERGFRVPDPDLRSDASTEPTSFQNTSSDTESGHPDETRGPHEKLTKAQRKRIPEEALNETHDVLADRYGVTRQYISKICKDAKAQTALGRHAWPKFPS